MSADLRALWQAAGGNVPDHWTFQTIEELLESQKSISVGVMYPGSNVLGGTPLIRVSDVKNGAIAKKPDFCISSEVDQEYRRTKLFGSELLITLVGNPGDCVIVTEDMIGWNAARALAVLKLKDPDLRRWLRYVLLSKPAKHLIDARLNTTVQKTLNLKDIRELGVPIPPKEERYKITNVIDAIENKMLLNTQTNQTLESIAQAIFKSWFVDFEPVKAKMAVLAEGSTREQAELAAMGAISGKSETELAQLQQQNPEHYQQLAETAALFPSAMVESELGEIPEGWEIVNTESISEKIGMGPFGSNIKVSTFVSEGIPIISGQHLRETLLNENEFNYVTAEHAEKLKNSCVKSEDIIFTHAGNIGQVSIIPKNSKSDKYIISQRQFFLRANKKKVSPYFLVYFFRSPAGQHLLLSNASQVGVPSIARPSSHLKSIELVLPSFAVMGIFERTILNVCNKIIANRNSTATLAALRDSLLPKLLSGEIDLSDIKSEVV